MTNQRYIEAQRVITDLLKQRGIPADVAALIGEMKAEILELQATISVVGRLLSDIKTNPGL